LYTIRSSLCCGHPALLKFDSLLPNSLSIITNNILSTSGWLQASLLVRDGGLGIRSVVTVAPSAVVTSVEYTCILHSDILRQCPSFPDTFLQLGLEAWSFGHQNHPPTGAQACLQRQWDRVIVSNLKSQFPDTFSKGQST